MSITEKSVSKKIINMFVIYLSLFLCVLPQSISKQCCCHKNSTTLVCNYFPGDIPKGVSSVIFKDFRKIGVNLAVNASFFLTKNWKFVKYLELTDESSFYGTFTLSAGCFTHLQMLNEIHLHLADFILSPDAFIGTNSVRVLNMRACVRLNMHDFLASLNGTNKLTNLEVLDMSRLGDYRRSQVINLTFGQLLQSKRITDLIISTTEIGYFDLGIFGCVKSLQNINVSHSQISHLDGGKRLNVSDLTSLKVIDFSYLDLPKSLMPLPGKFVLSNSYLTDKKIIRFITSILTPLSVNLTSIISKTTSIWIINCTFPITKPLQIRTREIVIKENNLKYFDLRCINHSISSIEEVDVSGNDLEFISPCVSSCFPRIKRANLSKNQLFLMAKHNITLFSNFVKSLSDLESLSYSGNYLEAIPYDMFSNSFALEEIDLSHNNLQQVTFNLEYLDKLKILNLGSNLIHILNEVSINRLNAIPYTSDRDKNYPVVILKSNSISCSTCDAIHFIQWILETNYVNVKLQDLQCLNDNGRKIYITTKTVKHLKYLCHLELYITLSCSFLITLIIIVLAIAYKMHKRRLLIKQREHRYNVIERLRGGRFHYKYACYLVYSLEGSVNEDNHDEQDSLVNHDDKMTRDFIEYNFIAPLERNLEHEIEVDRQLVCSDEDADGGRSDLNVFFNNLASSSAVVVIASRIFFSNALYCWMLEQVIAQGKYIIFLIEDGVTFCFKKEETKRIFKNSKRFKWKIEADELVLKSSWRELCFSILDITSLSENDAE